jgi:hypothetical protein
MIVNHKTDKQTNEQRNKETGKLIATIIIGACGSPALPRAPADEQGDGEERHLGDTSGPSNGGLDIRGMGLWVKQS